LDANPFIDGETFASLDAATASLEASGTPLKLAALAPSALGSPTKVFLQSSDNPGRVDNIAFVFSTPANGVFRVIEIASPLDDSWFDKQIKQHAETCDDPRNECSGTLELLALSDGRRALADIALDDNGKPISGGLFWLLDGKLFILEMRPEKRQYSVSEAVDIANEFVEAEAQ
jgi:hypothetical protein